MSSHKMTPEQQKFLQELEEEFKDRYTEKDVGYKATLDKSLPSPPTEVNWREYRSFAGHKRSHSPNRSDYHPKGPRYGSNSYQRSRYN